MGTSAVHYVVHGQSGDRVHGWVEPRENPTHAIEDELPKRIARARVVLGHDEGMDNGVWQVYVIVPSVAQVSVAPDLRRRGLTRRRLNRVYNIAPEAVGVGIRVRNADRPHGRQNPIQAVFVDPPEAASGMRTGRVRKERPFCKDDEAVR